MATTQKAKAAADPANEAPVAKAPAVKESVYTAEELAKNHKVFKTSYEIVAVALRMAGVKTATFAEAQKIIEKFKNREVK